MSIDKFNVLILGNAAVGKTNIIKAYDGQAFDPNSEATLGIDYVKHKFKALGSEKEFDIKIWDTAGQERFESLTHSFYKRAKGMIVCFDLTNAESFKKVKKMDGFDSGTCRPQHLDCLSGHQMRLERRNRDHQPRGKGMRKK